MNPHVVDIKWERNGSVFTDNKYSRAHEWTFDGGIKVPGSSSPDVVPLPFSVASAVDPEEAFVASLSSCHMLWFLGIVAASGYVVDEYIDRAEGHLTKGADGKLWLSRVVLTPQVRFSGDNIPTGKAVDDMHHKAHEECYLANSVKTEIVIRSEWSYAPLQSAGR